MAKYRLSREDRTDFILKHAYKKHTLDQVVGFLKERIVLDEKKILEDAWKAKGRQLIRSYKDAEGIRVIAAYDDSAEGEARRMVYQMIDSCNDPEVLDKQILNMSKNIAGSDKLIRKAADRKEKISSQSEEVQFFDFEDLEESQ